MAEEGAAVAEGTTGAPCGGIAIVEPMISWASGAIPFEAASSATVSPSAAATEVSDSPGMMV
jgi:hypothetical protein